MTLRMNSGRIYFGWWQIIVFHKQIDCVGIHTFIESLFNLQNHIYIYILSISILRKYIIQFINISNFHTGSALHCPTHYFLAFPYFHTHHLKSYLVWCTQHCHQFEMSSSARIPYNSHLYKNKNLYYIDKKRKRVVIDSRASIKIYSMTKSTTPYHSTLIL